MKKTALVITSLVMLLSPLLCNSNTSENRPNVIIVMTDDQGYGDLSCHGNPVLKTPNLDQLSRESIRFTDFHVSPMCTPTRGQIMTGIDVLRNGATCVSRGRSFINPGIPTMADLFSENGYNTAIFGKWHLGDNYPYRPQDRGFQETIIHLAWGITSIPAYWNNDCFDDTYLHNGVREKYKGYCTDVWFNETMKWMKERQSNDEPFFVYLPTNAPHTPWWVADKYSEPYADYPELEPFFGMISNIDENMGRLISMLDETGLRENTILIFMTDNGTTAGHRLYNAGMRGHKGGLYEGGHRVPFFISWPNGNIGEVREINELTQGQDIFPTLMDLCELKTPEPLSFDGISLAEILQGRNRSLPDRTLVVQYDPHGSDPSGKWESAILWNKWRLVNGEELYNIDSDPGQANDISGDHPDVVNKMRDHYEVWWSGVEPYRSKLNAISIGSEEENPVNLSFCDWDEPNGERIGSFGKGFFNWWTDIGIWHLHIEESSEYEITLRRWTAEADTPITGSVKQDRGSVAGDALPIVKARIKIADVELSKEVSPEDKSVIFNARLNAGDTQLETWFFDDQGQALCGVYYVSVKKL